MKPNSRRPSTATPRKAATTALTCAIAALLAVAMSSPARAQSQATTSDFWRAPSVNAFAEHLQRSRWQHADKHADRLANEQGATHDDGQAVTDDDGQTVGGWQDDPQTERMKAWLEKGVVASAPPSMALWSDVQAHALRIGVLDFPAALRHPNPRGDEPGRDPRLDAFIDAQHGIETLNATIGLWPGSTWLEGSRTAATPHAAALVRTIELPAVRASWLTSEGDIALGHEDAEQLSGRFGVVHRMLRHDARTTDAKPAFAAESVGIALTRPLVKTVIHRDGRLDAAATHGRAQRVVWGDAMTSSPCDDFVPGFALGDADADFHAAIGMDAYARSQSARMKPVGSVLSIVTRDALPLERALPMVTMQQLDVDATGFATSTQLAYDLDADGVADLVVWEGSGAALPVDGRDRSLLRHRIFFANVQGEWRVLGHDAARLECEYAGGC